MVHFNFPFYLDQNMAVGSTVLNEVGVALPGKFNHALQSSKALRIIVGQDGSAQLFLILNNEKKSLLSFIFWGYSAENIGDFKWAKHRVVVQQIGGPVPVLESIARFKVKCKI